MMDGQHRWRDEIGKDWADGIEMGLGVGGLTSE